MSSLQTSSAFPELAALPVSGPPSGLSSELSSEASSRLAVEEIAGLGVARIMARAGQAASLAARLQLPQGPRFTETGGLLHAGVAPGIWLAIRENAPADWGNTLAPDLSGYASVADQSGAYAMLRLTGPAAADVLNAGIFLDFHPDIFGVGGVAATRAGLIDAIILRRAADVFDVAIYRSFSSDFMRFVLDASAARGLAPVRRF